MSLHYCHSRVWEPVTGGKLTALIPLAADDQVMCDVNGSITFSLYLNLFVCLVTGWLIPIKLNTDKSMQGMPKFILMSSTHQPTGPLNLEPRLRKKTRIMKKLNRKNSWLNSSNKKRHSLSHGLVSWIIIQEWFNREQFENRITISSNTTKWLVSLAVMIITIILTIIMMMMM